MTGFPVVGSGGAICRARGQAGSVQVTVSRTSDRSLHRERQRATDGDGLRRARKRASGG